MPEETDEEIRKRLSALLGTDYLPKDIAARLRPSPVPSMTAEEVQKLEPGLGGSYPLLSMVGGAKGARSLIKTLYEAIGEAAKPPPTVMKVRKGEDYLPTLKEWQSTKEGVRRGSKARSDLEFDLDVAQDQSDDSRWWRFQRYGHTQPPRTDPTAKHRSERTQEILGYRINPKPKKPGGPDLFERQIMDDMPTANWREIKELIKSYNEFKKAKKLGPTKQTWDEAILGVIIKNKHLLNRNALKELEDWLNE